MKIQKKSSILCLFLMLTSTIFSMKKEHTNNKNYNEQQQAFKEMVALGKAIKLLEKSKKLEIKKINNWYNIESEKINSKKRGKTGNSRITQISLLISKNKKKKSTKFTNFEIRLDFTKYFFDYYESDSPNKLKTPLIEEEYCKLSFQKKDLNQKVKSLTIKKALNAIKKAINNHLKKSEKRFIQKLIGKLKTAKKRSCTKSSHEVLH